MQATADSNLRSVRADERPTRIVAANAGIEAWLPFGLTSTPPDGAVAGAPGGTVPGGTRPRPVAEPSSPSSPSTGVPIKAPSPTPGDGGGGLYGGLFSK